MSSDQPSGTSEWAGFSLYATAMLALQAVLITCFITMFWSRRLDGGQLLPRARSMELVLPIAPRASWSARLIAHVCVILAPLLVTWGVLGLLGHAPVPWLIVKIGAGCVAVVLLGFGWAPERASLDRRSDHLIVTAGIVGMLALLAFDLAIFAESTPGAPAIGERFATEIALAVAVLWVLRGAVRLPSSWPLSGKAPAPSGSAKGAVSTGAASRTPRTAATDRRCWWRVMTTVLWPGQVIVLCVLGAIMVSFTGATNETMVPVLVCVAMLVFQVRELLPRSRFLATLPVPRRRVLTLGLLPLVVALSLGGVAACALIVWRHAERPVVTLDKQVVRLSPKDAPRGERRFDSWVDVVVPLHHWRLAGGAGVPLQVAPDGEQHQPRAVPVMGLPFLTVYNPYDAPLGSSQAFTAWQFSRALEAEFGVQLDADELSERYLMTQRDGQIDIANAQVRRNLDAHEAGERPWYGSMGTLVADFPELKARWDLRRAALPILGVAVLMAMLALLGRIKLPLRHRARVAKVLAIVLPSAILLVLTLSMGMTLGFGAGHPQVVFSILGDRLLSWLPDNVAVVWSVVFLAVVAAYEVLARTFEAAEQPMGPGAVAR